MTDNQLAQDIDTIARAEIVAAIEYGLSSGDISHESCPEIGANDWERVATRIKSILGSMEPSDDARTAAYERLIEGTR